MKILVPVKRVIDHNVAIRVKADGSGVDKTDVKMSMNPFCAIAVEEALRLKEAGKATEVIAISIGQEQARDVLHTALAMGADKAILIDSEKDVEPLAVAKLLQAVIAEEKFMLTILGKQSIDGDHNQTGQMLAGLLGWPQGTFASAVSMEKDSLLVTREIDGGQETLKLRLPAVVTTDLRLNEPRYTSLPDIMRARQKPLIVKTPQDYGVDITPRLDIISVKEPAKRQGGMMLTSMDALIDRLKNEAGVLS